MEKICGELRVTKYEINFAMKDNERSSVENG